LEREIAGNFDHTPLSNAALAALTVTLTSVAEATGKLWKNPIQDRSQSAFDTYEQISSPVAGLDTTILRLD